MVDRLRRACDQPAAVWAHCAVCDAFAALLPGAEVCRQCDPIMYDWSADAAFERERRR
jgi:hypothetical protein